MGVVRERDKERQRETERYSTHWITSQMGLPIGAGSGWEQEPETPSGPPRTVKDLKNLTSYDAFQSALVR